MSGRKRLTESDLAAYNIWTKSQPENLAVISICLYHEGKEQTDKETMKMGNN